MKCRFCGMSIDQDSVFCNGCGKRINNPISAGQSVQGSSYRHKKKRSNHRWLAILLCVILIAVCITASGIMLYDLLSERSSRDAVRLVQDGYLGEFTDITVKEILDINYGYYEKSVWDGGKTDAGIMIVEAKYCDDQNLVEPTIIQFEILNDECFRVSAFTSPFETIEQSTDLFAVLNYDYLVAYAGKNRLSFGEYSVQVELITRLDRIPGSAVAYGSTASYTGNRASICTLNGEVPLEVSAAVLLDHYGKIDMAVLDSAADDPQPAEPEETQPEATTETVPKETVPPETTPPANEEGECFMVTVKWSSGGLNVRSGPGTNYEKVGRLNAGQEALVLEIQYNGSTQWGNIGSGWICLDYVDIGAEQTPPSAGTSTSVNMTVSVKISAGELKIRSGPDVSYSEIGRLLGGEVVTVTELQQNGSSQWGRISRGWICMDYVDIVFASAEERISAERFVGNWGDQTSMRCSLSIEHGEYGAFVIDIHWGNSAFSTAFWRAVGKYDAASDCIRYHDCQYWLSESDGNGNFTDYVYYTDGQGMLYFSGGNLLWKDYKEDAGRNCCFVRSQ